MKETSEKGAKIAQVRIQKENLVGKTYTKERLARTLLWAQGFIAGNVSFSAVDRMRPFFSQLCKEEVPNRNSKGE